MTVPVLVVLIAFAIMAKDSPRQRVRSTWRDYAAVLREPDTLWFAFLYSLTFGGFVGFTSFLTTFFREQYHVSRVSAGDFTTIVIVAGSLLRPVGGWLSDRIGGYRLYLSCWRPWVSSPASSGPQAGWVASSFRPRLGRPRTSLVPTPLG